MGTIMSYLDWRGDLRFDKDPFNEVDNLIFSKLSYLDLNTYNCKASLLEVHNEYKKITSNESDRVVPKLIERIETMFDKVVGTERFRDVRVFNYVNIFDKDKEMQFSAVCFEIDENSLYVAFRGTDDTLLGFKEDFNMSFSPNVNGQEQAAKYLNDVLEENMYETIFVGGHSKGGNFAVYSCYKLTDEKRDRISRIYNNDGPGFLSNVVNSEDYIKTSEKVVKILPKSSVVGILMNDKEEHKVISAKGSTGFIQHNGLNWEVKGNKFVIEESLTNEAAFVDETLKHWLENTSDEEKAKFVDEFYDIIMKTTNAERISEISTGILMIVIKIVKEMKGLDEEKRDLMSRMLTQFIKSGSEVASKNKGKSKKKKTNFSIKIKEKFNK